MMEIVLVRHGETLWNRQRRVQGVSDLDLTQEGRRQARLVARALRDAPIEAVYSSPLRRALATAEIINETRALPVKRDPRLAEMDQGAFEGLAYEELMRCEQVFLERWIADPTAVRMPGGETLAEVQERAWEAYGEIAAAGLNALVVSHSFTISALLCRLLGISLKDFRRVSVAPASVTILRIEGDTPRLVCLNDRRHLAEEGEGGD
ncbi:MAG TPA: histidine phosphatase family protein [Syntrophales bacterium]|nr:histidine phosphatase family protein [Syntrophales bacterium]HON99882.1 histidine phosphatase family protein [Syntrophales bacterium]